MNMKEKAARVAKVVLVVYLAGVAVTLDVMHPNPFPAATLAALAGIGVAVWVRRDSPPPRQEWR